MLVRSPWFGPKTVGWGWTPITWQAWAVTVAFTVAVLVVSMIPGIRYRLGILLALVAVFILVAAVTGTKPGGNL